MTEDKSQQKAFFACSGASDVGELTDRIVRAIAKRGMGRMLWLAGVSSGDCTIIEKVTNAGNLVVIDGCDLQCARKTMESAGFSGFAHIEMTKHGFVSGETKVDDQTTAQGMEVVLSLL